MVYFDHRNRMWPSIALHSDVPFLRALVPWSLAGSQKLCGPSSWSGKILCIFRSFISSPNFRTALFIVIRGVGRQLTAKLLRMMVHYHKSNYIPLLPVAESGANYLSYPYSNCPTALLILLESIDIECFSNCR